MAASCSIVCCEEERDSDKAAIVRFSNGNVQNPEKLDFFMYKSTDEVNPRKKHRRMLVAETDRISYVGQNFGASSLKCNSLCKYYVGVLNKHTMQMELHNAQLFNMQPVIPGETAVATNPKDAAQTHTEKVPQFDFPAQVLLLTKKKGASKAKKSMTCSLENPVHSSVKMHATLSKLSYSILYMPSWFSFVHCFCHQYPVKVDSLIEAFGTNKQKRALTSRRLNLVGSEILHQAVAKAANTVIDEKGLEVLQQEVAESQAEHALYLPPCNMDADVPEDVYPLEEILSPVDFKALEEAGSKMGAFTSEELQNMKDSGGALSVVKHLETMPSAGEARDKMACCAFYLSLLIKLSHQKSISRKFGIEQGCPRIVQTKLFRTFTVETFSNGRVKNIVSASMRSKLAAYCLALLLHMGHMTADLTLLHRDLAINEARVLEVARSMGLTLAMPSSARETEAGLHDKHKQASLVLPLVKYKQLRKRQKSKNMH